MLARHYIYFVTSPWTSLTFLICKMRTWQINSLHTFLAAKKSVDKWIAKTWLSAVSQWEGDKRWVYPRLFNTDPGSVTFCKWHLLCVGNRLSNSLQHSGHTSNSRAPWAGPSHLEESKCGAHVSHWTPGCLVDASRGPSAFGCCCLLILQKKNEQRVCHDASLVSAVYFV